MVLRIKSMVFCMLLICSILSHSPALVINLKPKHIKLLLPLTVAMFNQCSVLRKPGKVLPETGERY